MKCPKCNNEVEQVFVGTYGTACRECRDKARTPIKSIQEEWKEYRDAAYPNGTSGIQNKEVHQAFFAGALVALKRHQQIVELPDEDALRELKKFDREVMEVVNSITAAMKGRN